MLNLSEYQTDQTGPDRVMLLVKKALAHYKKSVRLSEKL
jgi:hypothetical protein